MLKSDATPFPRFEDTHYGDVKAGDYVYDRYVSRFVRVVEVVEHNAVEVELRLYGGDALIAGLDTPIARRVFDCPACYDVGKVRGYSCPECSPAETCPVCGDDREFCPDTRNVDTLRQVAADWHGGQSSPLYAFSSTGTIVEGLEAEIRGCLKELVAGQYRSDDINAETPRLSALLDYVVSQTPELEAKDGAK